MPIGWLHVTYHLLTELGNSIDDTIETWKITKSPIPNTFERPPKVTVSVKLIPPVFFNSGYIHREGIYDCYLDHQNKKVDMMNKLHLFPGIFKLRLKNHGIHHHETHAWTPCPSLWRGSWAQRRHLTTHWSPHVPSLRCLWVKETQQKTHPLAWDMKFPYISSHRIHGDWYNLPIFTIDGSSGVEKWWSMINPYLHQLNGSSEKKHLHTYTFSWRMVSENREMSSTCLGSTRWWLILTGEFWGCRIFVCY